MADLRPELALIIKLVVNQMSVCLTISLERALRRPYGDLRLRQTGSGGDFDPIYIYKGGKEWEF